MTESLISPVRAQTFQLPTPVDLDRLFRALARIMRTWSGLLDADEENGTLEWRWTGVHWGEMLTVLVQRNEGFIVVLEVYHSDFLMVREDWILYPDRYKGASFRVYPYRGVVEQAHEPPDYIEEALKQAQAAQG